MVKTPCYNCDKRHEGCHSKCEEYASWKLTRTSPRSRATYGQDEAINAYVTERINKRSKR